MKYKSDIRGKGYGDCHQWQKQRTRLAYTKPRLRYIEYQCRKCKVVFYHRPFIIDNPFVGMAIARIKPTCEDKT